MGNEVSSNKSPSKLETSEPPKHDQIPKGIVVVTKKPNDHSYSKEVQTITRLEECPTFEPLVPSLLSRSDGRPLSSELVHQLPHQGTLNTCVRLQNHFQLCAENAKTKQSGLCIVSKEIDRDAFRVMQKLTERQRLFARLTAHSQQVEDISSALDRVKQNLDQSALLFNELNSKLPEELRLQTTTSSAI